MNTKDKERKQLNIRVEQELYDFLSDYASANYKTVTAVIREMIVNLYKQNRVPLTVKNEED